MLGEYKQSIKRVLRHFGYDLKRSSLSRSKQLQLYTELFGVDAVKGRRFYNIGAGDFRHAYWTNVDHPSAWYSPHQARNIHVPWDISSLQPFAVEDQSASLIYTSHTIEHLQDEHTLHMFVESNRVLKAGGIIRVTSPDILRYYEGYQRRNPYLLPNLDLQHDFSIQDVFLYQFVSQFSRAWKMHSPSGASDRVFTDSEIDQIFSSLSLEEALNFFTKQCNFELQRKTPGAHINWWHYEKIKQFLSLAGFKNIRRSAYGQSTCPVLQDITVFDNTHPELSVYVEAEK